MFVDSKPFSLSLFLNNAYLPLFVKGILYRLGLVYNFFSIYKATEYIFKAKTKQPFVDRTDIELYVFKIDDN